MCCSPRASLPPAAWQAALLLLAVGFLLQANPAGAGEAAGHFRYNAELKKCLNDHSEEGLNQPSRDERDNECADYRGKLVIYLRGDDTNFRGANFDGDQFRYLNFMARADFTGAKLTNIIGDMADFRAANFSGADFTDARLKPCRKDEGGFCMQGARFDASTILPFSREEALTRGMVAADEKKKGWASRKGFGDGDRR